MAYHLLKVNIIFKNCRLSGYSLMRSHPTLALLLLASIGTSCRGNSSDGNPDQGQDSGHGEDAHSDTTSQRTEYAFESRFVEGSSSVSYTGQTLRHALVTEMKAYLGGVTDEIDAGYFPEPGEVQDDLLYYFETVAEVGGGAALVAVPENTVQVTLDDIASGKNLVSKIAGNDSVTDHKDWSTEFAGWEQDGVTSPESLVRTWISEIDAAAVARGSGEVPTDQIFLSADGVDRQQLLQKFLTGAVPFSQAADDYMDWTTPGKGLLSDNSEAAGEGSAYSALEHAWDEGFGYFGANREYGSMTAADIVNEGWLDANGDERVDLNTEYVWGASMNAAKRDLGATVQTRMVHDAFDAFVAGRELIVSAGGELSDEQLTSLEGYAQAAIANWEMAAAATVIHYINALRSDLFTVIDDEGAFDLNAYAKHWAEAKGFGLWPQFNPRSPLVDTEFAQLHELLGLSAPVWTPADGDDTDLAMTYYDDLETVRDILCEAYAFEADNCTEW